MLNLILIPFDLFWEVFDYWQHAVLIGLVFISVVYILIRLRFFKTILFSIIGLLIGWIAWIMLFLLGGSFFSAPIGTGFIFVFSFFSPVSIITGFIIGIIMGIRRDLINQRGLIANTNPTDIFSSREINKPVAVIQEKGLVIKSLRILALSIFGFILLIVSVGGFFLLRSERMIRKEDGKVINIVKSYLQTLDESCKRYGYFRGDRERYAEQIKAFGNPYDYFSGGIDTDCPDVWRSGDQCTYITVKYNLQGENTDAPGNGVADTSHTVFGATHYRYTLEKTCARK